MPKKNKPPRERSGHLVQARLEPKTFREVRRLAKAEGRSVGAWIRQLVEKEILLVKTAFERFVK